MRLELAAAIIFRDTDHNSKRFRQSIVKIKNTEREADVESVAAKRKIQEMVERCINYLKEREVHIPVILQVL